PFNIYTVDTTTGVATSVGNLSFASATIARQPSTGLIYYYAINASGGLYQVATWNPSTGANTTLAGTVNVYLPRLAFKADGNLYASETTANNSKIYKLSTATGAGTFVGNSGAALSDLANLPAFADLQMTKTATSGFQYDPVTPKNATYSLTVKNNGPQSAS